MDRHRKASRDVVGTAVSGRARRVVKRAFDSARRRSRRPWAYLYPRLMSESSIVKACRAQSIDQLWTDLSRQPFFVASAVRPAVARAFSDAYPADVPTIVDRADTILRHEFELLGSGARELGHALPWHTDFKTGRQWPLLYSTDIEFIELDRPSDVKVPWELSRCQHFVRLGQAYWLTGDERYAREFASETTDWSASNPFCRGVNWACAMDVALRAVSWIWGFHFFADADACRDPGFRSAFLRALFLHGEFIVKFLEKGDLNGNHYLCDGVGLVFLGLFFARTPHGRRWLSLGRSIVEGEILKQTTPDGVDFEASTAYHRLVLEAFLTSYVLLQRHGHEPSNECWARLARMCDFVAAYTKPDGSVPLIGDADDGRIQILGTEGRNDHRYLLSTAAVLLGRGDFKSAAGRCWGDTFWLLGSDAPARFATLEDAPAEIRSRGFGDGGFYILRSKYAHVVVDCGEVGFGGRGGHGHNDILSFELFLNGFNVVTDCGAYLYTASAEWRNRFRSTAFHNTVQVDREELNRFIAPHALWQLRYDAMPVDAVLQSDVDADSFRGAHSGYERLQSPVRHARTIVVDKQCPRVAVHDHLSGEGEHELVWRFHLDPAAVAENRDGVVRITSGPHQVWLTHEAAAPLTLALESGWVSPSYGVKLPSTVVTVKGIVTVPFSAAFGFAAERSMPICVRFS